MDRKDWTGLFVGKTLVLKDIGRVDDHASSTWLCACHCGKLIKRRADVLTRKTTYSCGCLGRRSHKMAETRIYSIWASMRQRCLDKKASNYPRYGGKGVTVCEEWNRFTVFYKEMGNPPSHNHSLDRIDNTNGYCKENCRWANPIEQARNKCNSVVWTINGLEYESLKEAAEKYSVSQTTIRNWCDGLHPRSGCTRRYIYPQ